MEAAEEWKENASALEGGQKKRGGIRGGEEKKYLLVSEV